MERSRPLRASRTRTERPTGIASASALRAGCTWRASAARPVVTYDQATSKLSGGPVGSPPVTLPSPSSSISRTRASRPDPAARSSLRSIRRAIPLPLPWSSLELCRNRSPWTTRDGQHRAAGDHWQGRESSSSRNPPFRDPV
ncbi:hypothetical protein ABZ853_00095 [Streptomyces albidoflavus]